MVHQSIPLRRPGHSDIKAKPGNGNPVKPREQKSFLVVERSNVGRKGGMNSIPDPVLIAPSAPDSGAVPLPARAASLVGGEENRPYRKWSNFSVAIRTVESRLFDDSAYREVSLGREISVVFSSNGPLVYRPETNLRPYVLPENGGRRGTVFAGYDGPPAAIMPSADYADYRSLGPTRVDGSPGTAIWGAGTPLDQ